MKHLSELLKEGYDYNPHFWLGDGFLYCNKCKKYNYHKAFSKRVSDYRQSNVLVCKECEYGE